MSISDEPSKKRRARSVAPKQATAPKPPAKPPDTSSTTTVQREEVLEVLGPVLAAGKENEAVLRVQTLMRHYQGPIPLAAEYAAYEKAYPGSANRILTLTEKDQDGTLELNKMLLSREGNLRARGQILAFLALLAMLGVTLTCVLTNHAVVGTIFGGGTIIAVVAMFLRQQAQIKNGDSQINVGGGA